jgi:hypothetical protein
MESGEENWWMGESEGSEKGRAK